MAELNANLQGYRPADTYETIPAGEYQAMVIDSSVEYSKAMNLVAKFTWQITEGEFSNRQLWDQMVIQGANDKAVEIGMRKLKAMAVACKLPNPDFIQNTDEFHGIAAMLKVTIEKDEKYGDRNRIKAVKPLEKHTPIFAKDGFNGPTTATPTQQQHHHQASPKTASTVQQQQQRRKPWEKLTDNNETPIPF